MQNSIYISQNIPNYLVKRYNLSQAANNFCLHINELGYFSTHIAIPPGNVDGTFKSFKEEETGIEYKLCRPFKHKGIGKAFNLLCDNLWLYWRVLRAKEKNVWFYNVWTGNLQSYILIRFLSSKKCFILLADYNPARYSGKVGKLILNAIKSANGVISLSARCAEVNKNFIGIPGIIPERKINRNKGVFQNNKTFLLSGTLNANTGLNLALEVFKDIPEATLYLSGSLSAENQELVNSYTSKYHNIVYKGFFEHIEDYISFLQSVDYTLSLRDPASPVNHYNFPSKILETLAFNKVVISTIEYKELDGVNYIVLPYELKEFKKGVNNLLHENNSSLIDKCINNTDILLEKYSEKSWIEAFTKMENK